MTLEDFINSLSYGEGGLLIKYDNISSPPILTFFKDKEVIIQYQVVWNTLLEVE